MKESRKEGARWRMRRSVSLVEAISRRCDLMLNSVERAVAIAPGENVPRMRKSLEGEDTVNEATRRKYHR